MPDLLVVMGATKVRGTMNLYMRQLSDAGIEVYARDISGLDAPFNLGMKIEYMRWAGSMFSHYEKLVLSDSFDVTFHVFRNSVLRKIPDDGVLWAAEKNCYPDKSIEDRIPNVGPRRFANGGLLCGTPRAIVEWANAAQSHPGYRADMLDQEFLNERLAESSPLCRIDSRAEIFCCLYGGYEELEFNNGIPRNRDTGTSPNFLHANGNWSSHAMLGRYVASFAQEAHP